MCHVAIKVFKDVPWQCNNMPRLSRPFQYCCVALKPLTYLSVSTQSFTINGNLVEIYILIINCTKLTQTSLHFLRYNTFSRKEQTTLNRLLLGHCHLTHSYLLNKDPAPTCEHYKCVLTIEHILCTCAKYEHNWKQYFPNSQLSYYCILQHVIFSTISLISTF